MKHVLVGHRAAVNVVDFDEKYIVSASGDRTIKVTISPDLYKSKYIKQDNFMFLKFEGCVAL